MVRNYKHEIIKVCEYVLWLNRKVTINRLIVYPPFPHVPNGEANKCRGDQNPSLLTQKKSILSLSTFNWILMPKPKSTKSKSNVRDRIGHRAYGNRCDAHCLPFPQSFLSRIGCLFHQRYIGVYDRGGWVCPAFVDNVRWINFISSHHDKFLRYLFVITNFLIF